MDIEALVALEGECFDSMVSFGSRQIRRHISKGCILVALNEQGRIVAQATFLKRRRPVSGNTVRLYNMSVSPLARRQGLARRLFEIGRQHFVDKETTRLFVEVEEGNHAIFLYRNLGFKEEAIIPEYYGQNRNGVRMVLTETPGATTVESKASKAGVQ